MVFPTMNTPLAPKVLLIHPPMVRPTEPPIGVSAVAGLLQTHGIPVTTWDANLAGVLAFIDRPPAESSPRSRQTYEGREALLRTLRSRKAFHSFGAHFNAVNRLKHSLSLASADFPGWEITPTNVEHCDHHPFQAASWNWAFENPEKNPFVAVLQADLEKALLAFQPTHVGFSLNYLSQVLTAFAFAGLLKQRFPHLVLMAGGSLISAWLAHYPESRGQFPGFDLVLPGSAEETLLPLLLPPGPSSPSPSRSPSSPGTPHTPRQHRFEYLPAFDPGTLPDYLSPGPVLPLSFSRGCYWTKCQFCTEQLEQGNFLMISPAASVAILKQLETTFSPTLFHFGDNAISPALCQALINAPLHTPWYGFIRFIDHFQDPDFCRALRKAGCIMLQLGLESGHPGVLEAMQKGITPPQAERALRNLHEAGIGTYVYLLFGTPFEQLPEAETTLQFVARNHASIDFVNLAIFSLPIQSPESRDIMAAQAQSGCFPLYFDYQHPRGWSKTEVRRFLDREFKAHPAIKPIIQRKPLCFTSNHGPFFCLFNRRAFGPPPGG
jgi:hypothetical protein